MNRETAGSKQQPFNAIDVKMFHLHIKNNSFSCHYALLYLQNLATSFYSIMIILKGISLHLKQKYLFALNLVSPSLFLYEMSRICMNFIYLYYCIVQFLPTKRSKHLIQCVMACWDLSNKVIIFCNYHHQIYMSNQR